MNTTRKTWKILVADDHALVREAICLLINTQPDMQVVAEAKDGESAWQLARELQPDIIVMDISMPKLTGAQAAERLRAICPDIKILVVSAFGDDAHVRQLLAAGAAGYVLKESAAEELVLAIRTIAEGGVHLDPRVSGQVVAGYLKPDASEDGTGALSPRETEVLLMIAYGHTNKEIAQNLYLSVKTIEGHKARIGEKLELRSRAEIVNYALRRGWLTNEN